MSTKNVENISISDKRATKSGARLKQSRKELGYSQQDIAEYLGKKDRSSISNIEHGKTNPSIEELMLLSIKYKKSPIWLSAIEVLLDEKDLDFDHPDVSSVDEEINEIEREVDDISDKELPRGANLESLRSSKRLIESFLKSFETDQSGD